MSIHQSNDESHSDKTLKDILSENERKMLALQIEFVRNIPEWARNPVNHKQVLQALASLPSAFHEHKDLQKIYLEAINSLPLHLLNKYLTCLSGASADEEKNIATLLSVVDSEYEKDPAGFIKTELTKVGPDGYKGSLQDGHNFDDIEHEKGLALCTEVISSSPDNMSVGDKYLEFLKQKCKTHHSNTFDKFVRTNNYGFEAFMQSKAIKNGLKGLWRDEYPISAQEYELFLSGEISNNLPEILYAIFTDACDKATFQFFKAFQSPEM